ncbi:helicase-like protein [Leucobacter luti]|uniref:DEAD/DEAH box helicase n=1 Tax=Leucobacter luti TaxID=340320 RepID=UPI001049AD0E|nr:DEAD/DEAH box helicase [Leucobacter luti]MCW2287995.1 superfamily II DNA or RNA helicase [Leucobacter luti]TCK45843.1 helicase-like protein [Leucobacter luti]
MTAPRADAEPSESVEDGACATQPEWRTRLAQLVARPSARRVTSTDSRESEPSSTTQLALQFELRELIPRSVERWNGPTSRSVKRGQPSGSGVYRLGTRPVLRTERGWAKGALTWSNIGHQGNRLSLALQQQRWFRQFYALHRAAETITVGQDPNWVFLDDFASPALWAMLAQADSLGIALVAAGSHAPVELHALAELSLDATSDASGGLRIEPLLLLDGARVDITDAGVIGGHGLYLAGRSHERGAERTVRLAPIPAGISTAEATLLTSAEAAQPILVPAAAREVFFAEVVPELRAGFQLDSADGSVTLPAPQPGVIVLTATWRSGHRLSLSWSIEGGAGSPVPVLSELLPQGLIGEDLFPEEWLAELPVPSVKELRGVDAAAFLGGVVPSLERIPGLVVRRAGNPPDYREAVGAPLLTVTTVPSEQDDWFDLSVLVTVDGKTVPFAPLFRALALGRKKLLLVDNTYLALTHPAFAPLAELIAEAQDLDEWETGPRISRHQVTLWAEFEDLADESEAAVEWRSLVREIRTEHPVPVPVPATVTAELRPYQLEGFHWLAFLWRNRLGGILADDMGLGKTLQCLALMEYARTGAPSGGSDTEAAIGGAASGERGPFLVVAPTSVMSNWASEAARFAPGLRVRVRTATAATLGRNVRDDAVGADLIITSYALFRLDYAHYQAVAEDPELGLAGLILDEAQYVKNARAQANELAERLPVSWKLAVTGTPMENSLRELHAICRIVAPGLFPSARRFEEEYVRTIERPASGVSVGRGAGSGPETQAGLRTQRTERLRRRLRPFLLRRTKALVAAELPEKQEQILEVELDPGHRELYDLFMQRERQKLYGLIQDLDKNRFTVFRSLTLLRMLALDASLIDEQYAAMPSAKLEALAEHTAALASEGRRALVFSQFTSFLDRARERLRAAGVRTVTLDGTTRSRDRVIESFRAGDADVFLISLKAGGVGLNLTEADTVFLLDPWWNPASEAQAIDRTHRIGQQNPVHVIRMIALGTIEEKVLDLQRRKQALFDAVIDDEQLFSHAMTAADVLALLEDHPPA